MRARTFGVLLVAIVCGLAAAYLVNKAIGGKQDTAAPVQEDKVKVLVAKQSIQPYTFIKEQDRATLFDDVDMPKSALGEDYIPADRFNDDVKERTMLSRLSKGKYLSKSDLSEPGHKRIEHTLKEGDRAHTIKVTAESGVAGFIFPGDFVDVTAVVTRTSGDEKPFSGTILEEVEVIAIDKDLNAPDNAANKAATNVTLRLNPEQVLMLDYYQELGKLLLSKRKKGDITRVDPGKRTFRPTGGTGDQALEKKLAELEARLAEAKKTPVTGVGIPEVGPRTATVTDKPATPEYHTVQIFNGNDVRDVKFAKKPEPEEKK